MKPKNLYDLIRAFGYTTSGQTDEIVEAVEKFVKPVLSTSLEKSLLVSIKKLNGKAQKIWLDKTDEQFLYLVILPAIKDKYGPAPGYPLIVTGKASRTILIELVGSARSTHTLGPYVEVIESCTQLKRLFDEH